MSNKVRVGVIGVGYLGRFHAEIYARMPGVELVGVTDIDPAAAEKSASRCGCPWFASADALLARVEAVSVAVPTTEHLSVARHCLEKGVHLLLEKPIAVTEAEGHEIVSLAERTRATLQIGHLERFNAGVMALSQRIVAPRFIEAQRMGEFVERSTDVDVISDLMIHDIDIVLALVKSEIKDIAAVGTPVLTPHVDIANARIEFENGTVANVVASRVSDRKMRRLRIFEANRYESLDFIAQRLETAYTRPDIGQARPRIVRETMQVTPVKPLDAELADFIDCVRSGKPPLVGGRVGLAALRVALEVKSRVLG